jgi:hypothetical protein
VLGQLFLFGCVIAMFAIAAILFVVFGPVPVKRRVTVISRLSAARSSAPGFAPQWASASPMTSVSAPVAAPSVPSLVSQLAPAQFGADTDFLSEPAPVELPAVSAMPLPSHKPKGAKVQPLPRKRAAKGTGSPFAPVVRPRSLREEELATNPVPRVVSFDTGEMTTVDDA